MEGLLALGVVENARLSWADREAVVGSSGDQAQVGIGGRWVGRDQSCLRLGYGKWWRATWRSMECGFEAFPPDLLGSGDSQKILERQGSCYLLSCKRASALCFSLKKKKTGWESLPYHRDEENEAQRGEVTNPK